MRFVEDYVAGRSIAIIQNLFDIYQVVLYDERGDGLDGAHHP